SNPVFLCTFFKKNFTLSHTPQRKEKDCLNCGTTVQGKYCHVCGQENVVPKETFWHMVVHFFNDITHFDGSFFVTMKDLLFKPGFLSREYMKGRRVSYLHPVRMYVFTSAIFFLIFFSFFANEDTVKINLDVPVSKQERSDYIKLLQQKLLSDPGNLFFKEKLLYASDTNHIVKANDVLEVVNRKKASINFMDTGHRTFAEYDSAEKSLPQSKRDNWIVLRLTKIQIDLNRKFMEDPNGALKKFTEGILHRLPYMLLISLPFFALILKLVYIRRKEFYYADHGVFTIHLYVFTFLLLLLVFSLRKLQEVTGIGFLGIITSILVILLFFYLYKAMRIFYIQGRGKTILKFLIVSFWSLLMMLVLLVFFMFFSAATL
ncbi:MAG: DUF3667 domain-containing protein, partial [Chitinophagaceae bacterium]